MNYKKIGRARFIILLIQVIILSFIGFYIINKAVSPEVVPFDSSQDYSFELIDKEGLHSEVTLNGTEEISFRTPLLSSGYEEFIVDVSHEDIVEVAEGIIREISAYNAGDINQCSGDPCVSASGDNICKLLEQGTNVCAANWIPFGTVINVAGMGNCIVLDKMARRFSQNVDWAMKLDEKQKAFDFGRRNLFVYIIN